MKRRTDAYVKGMTLAAIGRLRGEHEAPVSRRLARTRREIRGALEQPIRELCHRAQTTYRASSQISATTGKQNSNNGNGKVDPRIIAVALTVAASETGETPALGRSMRRLHDTDPDTARSLGWR